jgi:hypothetical protein
MFRVCNAIFRETIELLDQKLYAFCNVGMKCTIPFFKYTMLLQILKQYCKLRKHCILCLLY